MNYGKLKLTSLAAAIALGCGAASAQQELENDDLNSQPQIAVPESSSVESESGIDSSRVAAQDEAGQSADDSLSTEESAEFGSADRTDAGLGGSDTDNGGLSADAGPAAGNPEELDELAQDHENIEKFVEAVKMAGLADSLTGDTEYTIFAPSNEALESMPEDWMSTQNREQLLSTLRAHIVADDVDAETAKTLKAAQTIDGGSVEISAEGDDLMVGGAKVVESDIQAGNLRIYVIDDVLEANAGVAAAANGSNDTERGLDSNASDQEVDVATAEPGSERGAGVESESDFGDSGVSTDDSTGLDSPDLGSDSDLDDSASDIGIGSEPSVDAPVIDEQEEDSVLR